MIYTLEELREKISPIAEKYQLRAVYIFGSYARNEAKDDSDVDILIDRSNSLVKGIIIGGLYEDLRKSLGKEIDLITTFTLEQKSTKTWTTHFIKNVNTDMVIIYG